MRNRLQNILPKALRNLSQNSLISAARLLDHYNLMIALYFLLKPKTIAFNAEATQIYTCPAILQINYKLFST